MSFFSGKISGIREGINQVQPPMAVDDASASVTSSGPDLTLDCFSPIELSELTSTISKADVHVSIGPHPNSTSQKCLVFYWYINIGSD